MGFFDPFINLFSSPTPAPIAPIPVEPAEEPAPAQPIGTVAITEPDVVTSPSLVTVDQVDQIMTYAGSRVPTFIDYLNAGMAEFQINTLYRVWMFLAQVAEESGELRYTKEIASGDEYEGRADLGNTSPGDGVKYKGRGLIQITGKYNYQKAGTALGIDLINNPELLETPEHATRSACWWWNDHGLNQLADQGLFTEITKRINGGTNGLDERKAYLAKAEKAIPSL